MKRSTMQQTIDDALAFTRASDSAGLDARAARALAAALADLPAAQARRICTAAREQRDTEQARVRRHNEERAKRSAKGATKCAS